MPFKGRIRRATLFAIAVIIACVVAAVSFAKLHGSRNPVPAPNYTSPAMGRIVVAVASTGRLSARSTVAVGSQVSGEISEVDADFNQVVRKGQVIARINPTRYDGQLISATAALTGAQASLRRALEHAGHVSSDLHRMDDLAQRQLISRSDLEQKRDDQSDAALQVEAARSSIRALEAAVNSARYDLDQTTIRSPVDGVVLERLIEPGQTVAASFETPVLFRIAEDLSKMKIDLAVDEEDIGRISDGNSVQFTVDAFPERTFSGVVLQRRIAPNVQGNNATYPVIVSVDNADGALVPGMLADATIDVAERDNVLKLPNAYFLIGEGRVRRPTFAAIQRVIRLDPPHLDLNATQNVEFQRASATGLQEHAKQERPPSDLAQFFGPAMASRIVVIDDDSGDPEIAIRKDRLRRLHGKFSSFRAALTPSQQMQWDERLTDLVNSRYAGVRIRSGDAGVAKDVLIGMSDDTDTQVLSGLTSDQQILLPPSGDR